ncbi:MAG: hypothetical protein LLG02_13045 [Pelosinus sp.]|nr:hypothetical protein [Pelosinus sp.]
MKTKNKFIGALVLSALALAVFTAAPNVSAANNDQAMRQNYQGQGMHMGRMQGNMRDTIAAFLGIDAGKIIEGRQAGKSMVQIASEQGKSEDELYNFMLSERKAQIDKMVANGQISAETAAAHEAVMKERIRQNINKTDIGPNCGGKNHNNNKGFGKHQGNGQGRCINQ